MTDMFGTITTESRVTKDVHRFRRNVGLRRPKEDMVSEEEELRLRYPIGPKDKTTSSSGVLDLETCCAW